SDIEASSCMGVSRKIARSPVATYGAILAVSTLLLGACGSNDSGKIIPSGDENAVMVAPGDSDVELEVGQQLVIDFGTVNSSVGDEFELVTEPDSTILADFGASYRYLGEEDEDGAPSELQYTGEAAESGETEVVIEYYYRGE